MKNHNEYGIRNKAIQLYNNGIGFNEILRRVQKSKGWLSKWLGRFREQGLKGLRDRSRAPKRIRRSTPPHMVKKVLAIRHELESHKTRRFAFSGIGAETIHWELERRRLKNIPSISTISRILLRHGRTKKEKPARDSFSIIIMGSHIEGLPQKKMVQDSPAYLEIKYGNLSDTCPMTLVLRHTLILKEISTSLLQREKSLSSEKLIPMAESRSMGSPTLLEKNWSDNMLLLLYLLIAKNLLSVMKVKSSNLLFFQLKAILLIRYLNHREVHDVMSIQSIKKRFTML